MTAERLDAYRARRIEEAAGLAVAAASGSGATTLLVFRGVAVEVAPGDNVHDAVTAHDAAVAAIVERETVHPLLCDVPPRRGDVVETLRDDHYTRIAVGTIGLVSAVTASEGSTASAIAVRFATRSVDYESADFSALRHVRQPKR